MTAANADQRIGELLGAGYSAMSQGDWDESRRCFAAALAHGELPEALEGLGLTAYYVDDVPRVFEDLERAYRLYRERGDDLGAARVACMLADDYLMFRGQEAVSNGWLQRARRLLEGQPPSIEHGILAAIDGFLALQFRHDVAEARRISAESLSLARGLGSLDLEVGALAMQGLALVYEGRVSEGMRLLDESTTAALAGDVRSFDMIVAACCYLIYACERVRDFERAAQWCEKVAAFCRRYNYRSMLAFCRTHYAAVLIWRGEWDEAAAELEASTRELSTARVGMAVEGVLRLGELRRRQGRTDDAAESFAQLSGHALATLGRAALAYDAADLPAADDLVERFLRQVPADNLLERVDGLDLALRVRCALGRLDAAGEALTGLEAAAAAVGTPPLQGMAAAGRGSIAAAAGDLDVARRCFEDAVDLFQRCDAPYETARARLDLARTLAALERPSLARSEARLAFEMFQRVGAAPDAVRAIALLGELGAPPASDGQPLPAGLTRREAEVLGLLARGLSNQEIAATLYLSVRTVERHISTIYSKIGAEGAAARAAASAFAFCNGLAAGARP